MEKNKRKENPTISYILELVSYKKGMFLASVLLALLNAVLIIIPYIMLSGFGSFQGILPRLIEDVQLGRGFEAAFYWPRLGVMIGCVIAAPIFKFISTGISHAATFHALKKIRMDMARRLSEMPLGDIERLNPGTVKGIMVERVDACEKILAHIVPEVTSGLLAAMFLLVLMFIIDWRLGLASLICVVVGFVFFSFMMKGSTESAQYCVDKTNELNNTAIDYINGIEVIKVFGKEDDSYERFKQAAHDGAYCYIDWMRRCIIPQTGGFVIAPYTLLGILPVGALLYMNNQLSLSNLIMVIVLSVTAISFLLVLFSYTDDLKQVEVTIGEVLRIVKAPILNRPEKIKNPPQNYDISVENVNFGYDEKEVLHDISLPIKQGTFTAFVGPSGAGKSTLAKLIASYYDPNNGSIKIGGVDLKDIPLDRYNEMVSYVSQNNYLFNMSIYENIRVAKPSASNEEIEEICRKCGVDAFIRSLEDGYNTVVGSKGNSISGGERQRITIARAMMKNAPIVILDEATAYTDPENEALIEKSLSALIKGKTLIVIAHRLNTITNADNIVVFSEGKIEETGTHQSLLDANGLYKKMWDSFKESEAK
ncbi:MAG: ABC transporter ATP-binding protein/permease [Bacilli bacterium]|nr:ABC transporter ATP-binding protein/permease [Bacilli bacterium]